MEFSRKRGGDGEEARERDYKRLASLCIRRSRLASYLPICRLDGHIPEIDIDTHKCFFEVTSHRWRYTGLLLHLPYWRTVVLGRRGVSGGFVCPI